MSDADFAGDVKAPLHLFAGYGVELEYMIVDSETLSVRPIADELLRSVAGRYVSDVEWDEMAWSNELALHVVELKTNGPAATLLGLAERFQAHVARVNELLQPLGARLMPTAMHPWMDPHREMRLWPHDYSPIYAAYDRIFDCRGHGWANLQSVHLNLPFANDAEFARLHAAIRLLLPILPALAASSPVADGTLSGSLDTRMEVYRGNSVRVPSVSGRIIPERADSREEYERTILAPMYADIAPLDPDGVLQDEFLNARGAIARFCRNTIEIRVLDVQECPRADVAICAAITAVLRALVDEQWSDLKSQQTFALDRLEAIFAAAIHDADRAVIDDASYLRLFGIAPAVQPGYSAGDLWRDLISAPVVAAALSASDRETLERILTAGPLARRIAGRLLNGVSSRESREIGRGRLREIYAELCACLAEGRMFEGA